MRPILSVACLTLWATQAFAQLQSQVVVSGLSAPVAFVQDPTQPGVQVVVEQGGRVRVVQNGALLAQDFLDLRGQVAFGGERGLLGLAFSPNYSTDRRFFVNFTDTSGNTVVARFNRTASNPLLADPTTRFDFGWPGCTRYIAQPFANHNGGNLQFGDDGYLYIGLGDGGGAGDPFGNAQSRSTLLGKMLRLDVSVPDADPRGFASPADNPRPFGVDPIAALCQTPVPYQPTGYSGLMWDIGLRNPWRYSFDLLAHGGSGALIVGDVGQSAWEEIDYEPFGRGGRNYGWRNREGAHDYDQSLPPALVPLIDPIHEYDHTLGVAVIGGYVYRGTTLGSSYSARYFFADFSGRVWSLRLTRDPTTGEATASDRVEHTATLGSLGTISSFGIDGNCELHVVSYSLGKVFRISSVQGAGLPGGCAPALPVPGGRTVADITVFRPSTGAWNTLTGASGWTASTTMGWGLPGDVPVRADLDGDGKPDLVVWRPSNGTWYVLFSSDNYSYATWTAYQWGLPGDVPIAADFDGDGRTDLAVWRPSNGMWYILFSSDNYSYATWTAYQWGLPTDIPIVADIDGDGKADLVVYRPSEGTWYIRFSSSHYSYADWTSYQWGLPGDVPMAEDFDGDGKTDFAVWRPSNGTWYVIFSSSHYSTANWASYQWGLPGDVPVRGDFDRDGKADLAVWRPSNNTWYFRFSSNGYSYSGWKSQVWGLPGDILLAAR